MVFRPRFRGQQLALVALLVALTATTSARATQAVSPPRDPLQGGPVEALGEQVPDHRQGEVRISPRGTVETHVANLAAVRESYDVQTASLEQLAALEAWLDDLQKRRALLGTLRGGARADQILAEVSRLMPKAMVLNRVSLKQDERLPPTESDGQAGAAEVDLTGQLEIEGVAASTADVGGFHTALVGSPCFREVRMMYARPTVRAGHKGREFRLTCRLPRFE